MLSYHNYYTAFLIFITMNSETVFTEYFDAKFFDSLLTISSNFVRILTRLKAFIHLERMEESATVSYLRSLRTVSILSQKGKGKVSGIRERQIYLIASSAPMCAVTVTNYRFLL